MAVLVLDHIHTALAVSVQTDVPCHWVASVPLGHPSWMTPWSAADLTAVRGQPVFIDTDPVVRRTSAPEARHELRRVLAQARRWEAQRWTFGVDAPRQSEQIQRRAVRGRRAA